MSIVYIDIDQLRGVPVECTTEQAEQDLRELGSRITMQQFGAWCHKYHTKGFQVDGRVATNLENYAMTHHADDVVAFNKSAAGSASRRASS